MSAAVPVSEQQRLPEVLELCRTGGARALDLSNGGVGLSRWPFANCERVTAVPSSNLPFGTRSFDVVVCVDSLELLNPNELNFVCEELSRVAIGAVIIGVPYRQDIRVGRSTCSQCGIINPPYAHRISFDESKLLSLFSAELEWDRASYSGEYRWATNPISVALLDFAGNPFGNYSQEEPCIGCGKRLHPPPDGRTLLQKAATRAAMIINRVQAVGVRSHAKYIDVRFRRKG